MITYIIIGITVVVSLLAFNNEALKNRLMFTPSIIKKTGQYERFITSGFIHSNWTHLFFNMYVFQMFGPKVELEFQEWFGNFGNLAYIILYFGAIVFSCLPAWLRHQDNITYRALGASGGTAAICFALVLIDPLWDLYLIFLPGISFHAVYGGIAYFLYEIYADMKLKDNVGHAAHYTGAIFGFTFPIILNYKLIFYFIDEVKTLLPF